ncbi:MAG: hypothetical protein M4579_002001 [Chaenotheca gracillima]|nr:MAG: hypothetical protein M4579_002001 [Chaenotheca gracillima]
MLARIALWCSLLWLLVKVSHSLPADTGLVRRDADFESVRTRLKDDHSGKGGDPKEKYWHESTFHPHYDGRFAEKTIAYADRRTHLSNLIQSYLATMDDLGAVTWIMHGTLLGWWWNRKIMPWDSDLDVQIDESTIHFLAAYYNMTTYHYKTEQLPEGKDYMLEINPRYIHSATDDRLNVIDARWIDMDTGLFIDITTVWKDKENPGSGKLNCKDRHHYLEKDLFPLRESYFENTKVKVPFAYTEVLVEEYGQKSITKTEYENHKFNPDTMEWEPLRGANVGGAAPGPGVRPGKNRRPGSGRRRPPPR